MDNPIPIPDGLVVKNGSKIFFIAPGGTPGPRYAYVARDLERKLQQSRDYYDHGRVHASLNGVTPICSSDRGVIALDDYQWRSHCRGLYQLPAAVRVDEQEL